MKAKALKTFYDKKEGITRKMGDAFTVSEERLKEINSTKFGIMVKEVAGETPKPKKGKTTKKG